MKQLKLLPLTISIVVAGYGISVESFASCTASGNTITIDTSPCNISTGLDTSKTITVTSSQEKEKQGQIKINTNLNGNDNALILDNKLGLRYTTQIGESQKVDIQSDGTAILYKGTELRANGDGIKIANQSTVKGEKYAINAPDLTKYNMRITLNNSSVDGDISINDFSGSGHIIETSGENSLRGNINGISNINVSGTLNVKSGQSGVNYNKAYLQVKADAKLNLVLENKEVDDLLTTDKIIFNNNSQLSLILGDDVTAEDIEGKTLRLLNIKTQSQKMPKEIHIFKGDQEITDTLKENRDLPKREDEWVELVEQGGTINSYTEDNNLFFQYKKSNKVKIKEESIANFLANVSEKSDFVRYILTNSIGADERENLLKQFPQNEQATRLSQEFLPDLSGADMKAAWLWTEQMRSQIEQRTLAYRHQLPSYEREDGWNLWATTSLARGKNNQDYGYQLNRYGLQVGMDRQINDQALLGFSAGFDRNSISPTQGNISKKMTALSFMPYFEWKGEDYFASANLVGGTYSVDSERQIGNTTASGSYSGFQVGYQLTSGIDAEVKGVSLRPFVSFKGLWLSNAGWKESGSPLALAADTQTVNARHLGVGLSLWKRFDLSVGKFVPSFDIQYYKQVGNSNANVNYRLVDDQNTPIEGKFLLTKIIGNQFSTKLNASLNITETLNLSSSLSYNKFGKYNETAFGLTLSNTF